MANKDYVRRGRSPKKPTPKKAASRRKPWRSGLLAVILVSAFGYGLYLLSKDPEPPQPVVVQPKPVTKPKPTDVIPPPPEEKWDYVDSLPKREVEVVAKEQKVSDIPYIMQCGAYKTMQQAEARKLDIAFQGLSSKIRKKEDSSWYRIVLGPYKFKRDAERDKHKLQRAKIEPCAIWKEQQ
ncbi:SPOR domain-containing protein [Vibrio aestuarianus]|uniref:SPOR domain-containing protein n=1 Tax=Vibrio aestuarianus TaxID=28171 RepID=A0A9X4IQ14_9VIBR|nr:MULTISPECIES: SPOR domain-containing protein [Vibrio]KOE84806.1 cell division protein FtsN [Vibrio alginolyticus]MDE1220668.1 SPOR domain-containing protein [Vibrio aestuarianus]MDE1230968.1 SPOR domain-containing protein [Vibrio aestuarianus]MDE1233683.1 SPOR domain-containing protein [Vibrio aestuarianus]MDE1237437.1 SPOR domain-containing protein [Vibrio aestuarianus]